MKIKYLNGQRLYYAVLAGGSAVIQDKNYLNRINVFPVPDSDTGTNLASTMHSIAERASPYPSIKKTLYSISDAALTGARGNSGLIFAQFMHGFSREIRTEMRAGTQAFAEGVRRAVHYATQAIITPVEGTMITVIRDWADAVYSKGKQTSDFVELLTHSLYIARESLKKTPTKLAVLAKAGVVDAGAKGFVDFLEGIIGFIKSGKIRHVISNTPKSLEEEVHVHTERSEIKHRYCTEAMLTGRALDPDVLRQDVRSFGDSAIVAGGGEKARIHIHTDRPADLFQKIRARGTIIEAKADDMIRQYEAAHSPAGKTAIVVDSSCDLPQELLNRFEIHMIPINLTFGDNLFLDKVTITPDQFYTMLRFSKEHPRTSIPALKSLQNLYSFLTTHYGSVIAVHLSSRLSGMYQLSLKAAESFGAKIRVIDSRQISVSSGLIVHRIAEAAATGYSCDEIMEKAVEWIDKTRILVDIQTLKYMVRGGRVSPLKGLAAGFLNLKPIITLDSDGRAVGSGKSFSRKSNRKKIIGKIEKMAEERNVWNYGIAHAQNPARAELYAEELTAVLGKSPAYIVEVAPVIGVHNGIGAIGIGLMFE